ncbi:hypothetical protein GQ55_2G297600 [Panicum hallii var. hallii]|uniref:Uncharacterized protein n=1 Tax=Panicum hallii var. hallii TaxID=1504633 RepID=A0A2T7ETS0_9POAL|nr:hypothetical protein GQ55_2G297600 [Panicum hallii var. hallii]
MSHQVGASSSPSRRLLLSTIASALTPSAPSHFGNVGGLARAAIYSRVLRPAHRLHCNTTTWSRPWLCAMSEEDVIPLFDFFFQWG